MTPLSQLQPGQRGQIARVEATDAIGQRLLEMGLLEGEEIEVVGFAPLGDPMDVRLRDTHLSLRKREAGLVLVSLT
jgi:Fe2+ transport system protein FeoA